jgi:hypothetical protein
LIWLFELFKGSSNLLVFVGGMLIHDDELQEVRESASKVVVLIEA